jgi:ubiquinone/menaquinone biosynthesis C-methylase UbiE
VKKDTAEALLRLSEEEYDAYASEFSNTRKFFWRELEFLKDFVHTGDKVLDIGCGNGRLVDVFENIDMTYTGIDSSKELIAIAQKHRSTQGTYIHASALSLPFPDNSFDTVFSIAVLHHIPSKEHRAQFVAEAHRVLKPGGMCILTMWNTLQWKFAKAHVIHALKKVCGISKLDFGDIILTFGKEKRKRFVHTLSQKGLQALFENNNFIDISVREVKRQSGYANFVVVAKKK